MCVSEFNYHGKRKLTDECFSDTELSGRLTEARADALAPDEAFGNPGVVLSLASDDEASLP